MSTTTTQHRPLPAVLGFAFVFVCFAEGFWAAVACLIGAAVFSGLAVLLRGEMSVDELRERAEAARSGFSEPRRAA